MWECVHMSKKKKVTSTLHYLVPPPPMQECIHSTNSNIINCFGQNTHCVWCTIPTRQWRLIIGYLSHAEEGWLNICHRGVVRRRAPKWGQLRGRGKEKPTSCLLPVRAQHDTLHFVISWNSHTTLTGCHTCHPRKGNKSIFIISGERFKHVACSNIDTLYVCSTYFILLVFGNHTLHTEMHVNQIVTLNRHCQFMFFYP